jgi:hypothetical protein
VGAGSAFVQHIQAQNLEFSLVGYLRAFATALRVRNMQPHFDIKRSFVRMMLQKTIVHSGR